MIQLTDELKRKVVAALLAAKENFDGGDVPYAHSHGIVPSIYSRLKNGEIKGLINEGKWLNLAFDLGVSADERKWNIARTEVFNTIEEDVMFCKNFSKSRMFVDDCCIGKSFTAKYLRDTLKNCFYIDCSECKTKQTFIRTLAKTVGVDHKDTYVTVKTKLKFWIKMLPKPMIILDEAGDLEYNAFLEIKELWNATEGVCGWYMMGADGLRAKIESGINNKKVGYRELFSRFSEKYTSVVPVDNKERLQFYKSMIGQVLKVNMEDTEQLNAIVKQCLTVDQESKQIGGLRRAESLLILNQ